MSPLFTLSFALAACGTGSRERPPDDRRDASVEVTDDAPAVDAASMRFFPPVLIGELNTALEERSPALASDGTSIYFARTEIVSGFNVNVPYVATRANTASRFRPPTRAAAFGTMSIHDFELADDELEWLYWRGLGQLAASTRADADDGWSAPVDLAIDGLSPSLSGDGLTLYNLGVDGTVQLRSRSARGAPWGADRVEPVAHGERIASIDVSESGLFLLVTSESGVFLAARDDIKSLFGTPALLFAGRYENARFGAADELISMIDASGPTREIAIATSR